MSKKAISLDNLATFKEQYDLLLEGSLSDKQDTLVSGTNIKTINNESILGSGNIEVQGGGGAVDSGDAQGSAKQEGNNLTAWGVGSFAEGLSSTDATDRGLDENSTASEILEEWNSSDPEGDKFTATKGEGSHAEGSNGLALGKNSHVEGNGCVATNNSAHAEGTGTQALDKYTHAEGLETVAGENAAHAEGQHTSASGKASHAEGRVRPDYLTFTDDIQSAANESTLYQTTTQSTASDLYAVGMQIWRWRTVGISWHDVYDQNITVTAVYNSKWFKLSKKLNVGNKTDVEIEVITSEYYDQTCGAKAEGSHTEGINTQATNAGEHAEGRYNKSNTNTIHSIGIGTSTNDKKNAVEVLDDGSVYIKGIGGYDGTNVDNAHDLKYAMQAFATERLVRIPNTVSNIEAATYLILDGDCTPVYVDEPRRYQLSSYEELGHGDGRAKYVNITKDEIKEIVVESGLNPIETTVPITPVTANPTLAGTESNLIGLEVAGSKYKVPQFELQSNLKGKKVSFIGDSITTYSGYLPSGNVTRYPRGVITNVNQTWWYQLIEQTGMVLGQNCSWDGSTCIGRSTSTTNAYGGCSAKRIGQLDDNGTPDIVICYIGINDWGAYYNNTGTHYGSPFTNGAFIPVGSYTGETAAPSGDLQTFSEAYGSMIYNIQVNYPTAKIYCCTLLHTNGSNNYHYDADGVFPSVNRDGVSLASYNECIRTLAHNIGAEVIDFANCGINWGNMSTYLEDGLHPNIAGMQLLCAKAKAKLEADFGYTIESFTPAQTFSVTNNLTNVTNSNGATTAGENTSYSATLIADTGYTLSSVTVTMGGADVTSTVYNNGVISIGAVTGNIVITANALLNVYTITNTLTNVSNSNNSVSINHGNSYSATLSPASGYTMQSVSVTMNGVDVTSDVYNNGSISIASVTGDLIITATATNQTVYGITNTLSHVTNSNSSVSVVQGDSYSGTLTADSHYELPAANVTVTMGGTDITSTAYTSSTGAISIPSVTGALVITATATAITHTITNNLTDATNSNTAAIINDGDQYSGTITPSSGYTITTATITMGGTDITSTAYNNGTISIASVTGNIVITIVATPVAQITWYTNFSQNSTSSFVASSKGWALDEETYANIYNKPINRISLVATANSGSIDLCVAPNKDAQSGFTNQQTINWTSANKSGNIVTLELANPITLSNGQYLCVYVNSTPATGAACYASGGSAGQFYSYVASAGHSTWGGKGSYSIQMNIGYYGQ